MLGSVRIFSFFPANCPTANCPRAIIRDLEGRYKGNAAIFYTCASAIKKTFIYSDNDKVSRVMWTQQDGYFISCSKCNHAQFYFILFL